MVVNMKNIPQHIFPFGFVPFLYLELTASYKFNLLPQFGFFGRLVTWSLLLIGLWLVAQFLSSVWEKLNKYLVRKSKMPSRQKSMQIQPLAKRLAEEYQLDWQSIEGTGKQGVITERDVLNAASKRMQSHSV